MSHFYFELYSNSWASWDNPSLQNVFSEEKIRLYTILEHGFSVLFMTCFFVLLVSIIQRFHTIGMSTITAILVFLSIIPLLCILVLIQLSYPYIQGILLKILILLLPNIFIVLSYFPDNIFSGK